ncbi:hypothetical protein [Phosphitispora fastidiosa]|uniref:hypothetical protein n=1 Tax=Phosphitispora fastidiosa TaxID=2837202 RepID=UPI001E469B41|nr:hypothetical protein [Phosphitispora fastidiosa]MBU7008296.1 hypothetical protein [Phosphitispora fastidiosa]
MTLRPVDMQVLLPKVSEVNRNQPIQNQQDQTQQQQMAAQFQKQMEIQKQKVHNSEKPDGQKIEQDTEEKAASHDGEGKKRRQGGREQEKQEELKDPDRGKLFDIKV